MPEVVEDWFKISGTSVNQIGSTAINTAIPFYIFKVQTIEIYHKILIKHWE